jgi:ABC-type transport system involved in cytochrome c biogenesis permease subunit
VALTFVIIFGFIWLPKAFKNFSYADAKLIGTFIIWLIYAVGLGVRGVANLTGKRVAVMSIIGFHPCVYIDGFCEFLVGLS